jgi:hypothetical protein
MLPHSYQLPAAVVLVAGGALACVAGYRLFKIVLAIYGFVLGAMVASSTMAAGNTSGMILAAVGGGIAGALILVFAYFIGIALVGAGLGALIAHAGWSYIGRNDPPALAVVLLSIAGALGALVLQRYVIIFATAFGGAWTMIVGGLAAAGDRSAPSNGDVWILYPMSAASGRPWVPVVWVVVGLIGAGLQFGFTGRGTKK